MVLFKDNFLLDAFMSRESVVIISVEKNSATVTGRRRRAVGDLSEYTPGIFEVEGIAKIREKVRLSISQFSY